jgi:hypothetical protein
LQRAIRTISLIASFNFAILFSGFGAASLFAQVAMPSIQDDSVTALESQQEGATISQKGIIRGTVIDVNDAPVPGATVRLQGSDPSEASSVYTNENGFFELRDVEPGRPYQVTIEAEGFSDWQSPAITLEPGQSKFLNIGKLRPAEVRTSMTVTPEITAAQQVEIEEKQRGFLIFPDFYAVYTANPAPLTTKLKFKLALRTTRDGFTLGGVTVLAGIGQASNNPSYVQGSKGFAERLGANYTDYFTDIMLYGAIFPSVLHQDPRYFYKRDGTVKSRVLHAFSSVVISKGDNGRWQPNYSELGGDMASAALSNLYYPRADRGVGRVFQGFAIDSAVHVAARLLTQFAFRPPSFARPSSAQDDSAP